MSRTTEELIRDLAGDLPPVKPLARVRTVVGFALLLSLPLFAWWFAEHGLRHQFHAGETPGFSYLASGAALLILAGGGLVFALTSVIPGRERDARAGQLLFGGGVALALSLFAAQGLAGNLHLVDGLHSSRSCILGAVGLAIPAGLVVARYVIRGAPRSLSVALAAGFTGGMGMAAILVHLTCAHADPVHMVLGHALAPLYGGVVVVAMASVAAALGMRSRSQ